MFATRPKMIVGYGESRIGQADGIRFDSFFGGFTYETLFEDPSVIGRLGIDPSHDRSGSGGLCAGLPRTAATNPNQNRAALAAYDGMEVKPFEYYETYLGLIFRPPYEAPDWLLRMIYDVNCRENIAQEQNRFLSNFKIGDPQTVLAQIKAPSLILLGAGKQALLAPDQADQFQSWMTNAPSLLIKYPNLGHYPYLDEPALIERDIVDFFDGDLDARLGRSQ